MVQYLQIMRKQQDPPHYELYSQTCTDGSYMDEGVDFTISYVTDEGIIYLCGIISIEYAEWLMI